MGVIVLGLSHTPVVAGDFPLRDTFALVLLFAGIGLLLVGTYLLFANAGPAAYPADPLRMEK